MKKALLFIFFLLNVGMEARAQLVCNSAANLAIFSNYQGGNLFISVDVNIPNLTICVCSHEPANITLVGTYVSSVVAVKFAGYNGTTSTCGTPATTINGAPATATTSIVYSPASPLANPNGNPNIICANSCTITASQSGCNTIDQIEAYFLGQFPGSTLRFHKVSTACWGGGVQIISAGGTCCLTTVPNPLAVSSGTTQPSCFGGCNGTVTATGTGGVPPYSYHWTGGPATASWSNRCAGTYTVTVTDNAATPATATANVTLTQPPLKTSTITEIACKNYNFIGNIITTSGTYKDTVQTTAGCDSIITLNLTISGPNPGVTQSSNTLTSMAGGATYQWVDCNNSYQPIGGANGQSFTATQSGYYAVVVTKNNCKDTSACKPVSMAGIEPNKLSALSVYPNPAHEDVTVTIPVALYNHSYLITDRLGKTVMTGVLKNQTNTIPIKNLTPGLYIMRIEGEKNVVKLEKF